MTSENSSEKIKMKKEMLKSYVLNSSEINRFFSESQMIYDVRVRQDNLRIIETFRPEGNKPEGIMYNEKDFARIIVLPGSNLEKFMERTFSITRGN